jgi:hypothetical protein
MVIKAVEAMAAEQGITTFKIESHTKTTLHPADWIAGVDFEDDDDENEDEVDEYEDDPNEDYEYNDELDDEQEYDPVDQAEIDELFAEPGSRARDEDANPNGQVEEQAHQPPMQAIRERDANSVTDESETDSESPRRSARSVARPAKYSKHQVAEEKKVEFAGMFPAEIEHCHNILADYKGEDPRVVEYTQERAMVAASFINDINQKVTAQGATFAQQYLLQRGLKKFGNEGAQAATKELDQLHQRNCFSPVDVSAMTPSEKKKAQEALMFLTEKRDGSIKGRMVYNGKPTREWMSREDSASPTVSLESIMLTATIDAKEGRDVMTADVPNAFIQAQMPETKEGEERIFMKITGVLVDLLVQMSPEIYGPYVVFENGRKVLYVQVLRALYGMLVAALLWYKKFRGDLEEIGFKFNPYDPCVANRTIRDSQHTVKFHVDDLMSSHMKTIVNDVFGKWLNRMYGDYGEVKLHRGKIHDYLGMRFDFSEKGKVKIDMIDYIASMIDESSIKLRASDTAPTPAAEDFFAEGSGAKLNDKQREEFHTIVAKGLFACKRARPDIHPTIATLCTRVRSPTTEDWAKLIRLLKYCNGTRKDKLILSADSLHVIKWYVDASFAVHPDFKSHTGGVMTFGGGAVQSLSRKQEAEYKKQH